jgi:predicted branched-subunit amino acid permease
MHNISAAAYSLVGMGLGGVSSKLATQGLDFASISAMIGAATAFLMAVSHVLPIISKAVVEVIAKWREARANPTPPVPPVPPVPPGPAQ